MMMIAALAAAALTPAEMTRVADAFDRAQLTQDRAKLETLIDDGLVYIDGSGKRQGKREFIEGWMEAGDRYNPITLIDRTMTPLGLGSFVTSAETTLSGTSGGKPFSSHFRFSDTFRRVGGKWKAIHIQVTRIGG
jgi:hypothetical protein